MKRRTIKQIARGFTWAAAVAGSLGLAHPAAAQTPTPKGSNFGVPAQGRVQAVAPKIRNVSLDPTSLRLVQARVQMAWLADPITFSYALSLAAGPQGVQVTGFVPNEGVRQRAIQLALQHSGMQVADGLKVHPGQAVRCAGVVSGADLQNEATAALQEALGDRAAQFRVTADDRGRVSVSGPCASADEQLQVALVMRRAGHCACVTTQLSMGDLPTAVAQADRLPEPAPARQTVMAWHPENSTPPVEPPPPPEVKTDSLPAKTEAMTAAAPGSLPLSTSVLNESPKLASIDTLPVVPAKSDAPTTVAAEPKVRADGEVYETTGEIQWENGPADAKNAVWSSSPDSKASPTDAGKMQEVIRARCGADVREVHVEYMADGRMHITLRMAPGGTARGSKMRSARFLPWLATAKPVDISSIEARDLQ